MKRLTLIVVLVLFTTYVFSQEQDAKHQIGMASAAVGRAIENKDFAALEKLWSPHFIVNSPANNVLGRDEVIAALKNGKLKYTDQKTTVERIDVHGDIGIVMGQESYRPTFGPENGVLLYRRFTDIWQKTTDGWVMIARQATIFDPTQKHY